jgi:hypothetical protein
VNESQWFEKKIKKTKLLMPHLLPLTVPSTKEGMKKTQRHINQFVKISVPKLRWGKMRRVAKIMIL